MRQVYNIQYIQKASKQRVKDGRMTAMTAIALMYERPFRHRRSDYPVRLQSDIGAHNHNSPEKKVEQLRRDQALHNTELDHAHV